MSMQGNQEHIAFTEICGHSLTTIQTDKFKTITLAWYTELPLGENPAVNALAVRLMVRAFGGMDPMGVNRKLQGLYGAYLQADAVKYGDLHSLQLKLTFVHDDHLPHPIANQAVAFFFQMFTAPVTLFGGFEHLVALEKKNLLAAIAQRDQDKSAKAYDQLLETLFGEGGCGKRPYGNAQSIEAVTPDRVRNAIEGLLSKVPYALVAIGNLEKLDIKSLICHNYKKERLVQPDVTPTGKVCTIDLEQGLKIREVSEAVEQAKCVLAYKVKGIQDPAQHYTAMLMAHILGGGPSSILFRDLREGRGLCYGVHARFDKFLGLMTIHIGLSQQNLEVLYNALEDHLGQLKLGVITGEQLATSKKMLINSYNALADSPVGFSNFIHSQGLAGLPHVLTDLEALINSVTLEGIRDLAGSVEAVGRLVMLPKE